MKPLERFLSLLFKPLRMALCVRVIGFACNAHFADVAYKNMHKDMRNDGVKSAVCVLSQVVLLVHE